MGVIPNIATKIGVIPNASEGSQECLCGVVSENVPFARNP